MAIIVASSWTCLGSLSTALIRVSTRLFSPLVKCIITSFCSESTAILSFFTTVPIIFDKDSAGRCSGETT